MAQVDFYTLKESGVQSQLLFACRLCEKAFGQTLPVYLHVNDLATAEELDNLLWSFKPDSFIPHVIVGMHEDMKDEEVTVLIGYSNDCIAAKGLLINLASTVPAFSDKFERIAEIVVQDEEAKSASRAHWLQYKESGHTLNHHQL